MQRFEWTEGASNKFWEIDAAGVELTVRFGRVGTAGQSKTKVFGDAPAALKERDKLIREKTAKGYVAVDAAAADDGSPQEAPAAAVMADPPSSAPPMAALTWPSGGYRWEAAWRSALPVVRGVHTPPLNPPDLPLEKCIPAWTQDNVLAMSLRLSGFAESDEEARRVWQQAMGAAQLQPQELAAPRPDAWLALLAQLTLLEHDWQTDAAMQAGLALHGPVLMLEATLELADIAAWRIDLAGSAVNTLRHAIACAPDAQHEAAKALAARARTRSHALALLCLDLFPHVEPWAMECALDPVTQANDRLRHCALPAEVILRHFERDSWINMFHIDAAVYLQIELHGEGALPLLTLLLQRASRDYHVTKVLGFMRPLQVPGLPAALATRLDDKLVRKELEALAEHHPAAVIRTAIERVQALADPALDKWAMRLALRRPAALQAALAALPDTARERFQADLARLAPHEAAPERIPEWLRCAAPRRKRGLPGFFVAGSLHRPVLKDGSGSLTLPAVERLATMLADSTLEQPDPGVTAARTACTSDSLARFAWDLFEAWTAEDSPPRENWAFLALGLFGDDDTARRLTRKIREWPGESAHQRAVLGLDLLAAIGSDMALMHLNGIASKLKFKALQARASEKIAAVAAARGFNSSELADRLVPDLGLDEPGALTLDFGPRQFVIGFDELLRPCVADDSGRRLKDLPKPLKSDDAERARAATERYKQLKKDAKALGSLQATRLEQAMVSRRRWTGTDFRVLFLGHPLMRHLAARLVWGVYEQDRLTRCFRIAEDWTLADERDHATPLPDDALVGIAHVMELPAALQTAFGQLLADYGILQPFKQLGRETFPLTTAETTSQNIARFNDKTVAPGALMGLIERGWQRGEALDGGGVYQFHKPLPGGLRADLDFSPGLIVGCFERGKAQRLDGICLRRVEPPAEAKGRSGLLRFEALDPILASELLRDIELIAALKERA